MPRDTCSVSANEAVCTTGKSPTKKSAVVIFLAGAMAYRVVFTSKVQATDANSNTGVYSNARNGWIVMLMWHVLSYMIAI